MAEQTIKPLLPVTKPRNTLQDKKRQRKSPDTSKNKTPDKKQDDRNGGIDTYA